MWMGSVVGLEKPDEPDEQVKFPPFSKALHDSLPHQSSHSLPHQVVPVSAVSILYTKTLCQVLLFQYTFLQNTAQALSRNLLAMMSGGSSAFFWRAKEESEAACIATTAKHCCFTSEV